MYVEYTCKENDVRNNKGLFCLCDILVEHQIEESSGFSLFKAETLKKKKDGVEDKTLKHRLLILQLK